MLDSKEPQTLQLCKHSINLGQMTLPLCYRRQNEKKEKLAYVYQSRLYVKNTCDILFSILRFHKGKKLRAEVEQTISERRRKTEPVSSKERVSSSGLSNKWLAGANLKIIVYPQYLYYFWFIFVRFKDWVVEFQPTACWKESS